MWEPSRKKTRVSHDTRIRSPWETVVSARVRIGARVKVRVIIRVRVRPAFEGGKVIVGASFLHKAPWGIPIPLLGIGVGVAIGLGLVLGLGMGHTNRI